MGGLAADHARGAGAQHHGTRLFPPIGAEVNSPKEPMNFETIASRPEPAVRSEAQRAAKISVRHLDFFYGKFQGLPPINTHIPDTTLSRSPCEVWRRIEW